MSSLINIINVVNTILNTPRIGWLQRGVPQAIARVLEIMYYSLAISR
ncbi:hypothetical protein [Vulcanisaeta sp. JCM 16161]|nr:hypothetical protein [Vulcanisaeta sp. JCM 16161]